MVGFGQRLHLSLVQECDGETEAAEAPRAADAVEVGSERARLLQVDHLGRRRVRIRVRVRVRVRVRARVRVRVRLQVDHQVDPAKVDASREQVGAYLLRLRG